MCWMLSSAMALDLLLGRLQEIGAIYNGLQTVHSGHRGLLLMGNLLCLGSLHFSGMKPGFSVLPCFRATPVHVLVLRPSPRLPLLIHCRPIKVAMIDALGVAIIALPKLQWMGGDVVLAV
jgi:hypothetical protein